MTDEKMETLQPVQLLSHTQFSDAVVCLYLAPTLVKA